MKISKRVIAAAALATIAVTSSLAGAAVVFSDSFATSTLNGASNPTATSTSYDIASTKNQSPASTIAAGHLKMGIAATTSGVNQAQARFATTPVALTTAGDSIEYVLNFTNTTGLLGGGTASVLYMGLYNSGGLAPATGLQSSGLNTTTGSSFATGGTQLWQGYNTRFAANGGSSQVYTRPQQNGGATTSANQDLVGNGAGGGLYNNPAGSVIGGNSPSTISLTNATAYTSVLSITLNADSSLQIATALYLGTGTGGTLLGSENVNATSPLTTSFDGLAFGWRQSGTSIATGIDVNALTINATIAGPAVPEPAALGLMTLPAMGLLRRRR